MDVRMIIQLIEEARREGRDVLLETEGLHVLQAMGIDAPGYLFVKGAEEVEGIDLSSLAGDRVVVKVISPDVLHKSDLGGVDFVSKDRAALQGSIRSMEKRLAGKRIKGFMLSRFVSYDASLGGELLIGIRWTEDFGPVVTYGTGGVYTEFLAENFKPGRDLSVFSPALVPEPVNDKRMEETIQKVAVTQILLGNIRRQKARLSLDLLIGTLTKFLDAARLLVPRYIMEFEVNPFVISDGRLVALDVLIKLGTKEVASEDKRPVHKLKNLLEPRSIAIIGVSEKPNPGHIILNNCLREGFDKERIFIIKPGTESMKGCRCVPDVRSLPHAVDLFILAIAANQVPEVITDIVESQKAESVIVIPGGLEEKEGGQQIVAKMRSALAEARKSEWQGPVINGGNCLGIRSQPGRLDTMFIPEYKFPVPHGELSPVAFISQSGAFAVSKTNKLTAIKPKFNISVGNQMDLRIGDYLFYLKDDPDIDIFAVYVEGFKPLDGLRFIQAANEITSQGRTVILYRAGRTSAGAKASASHTASLAGDYVVTRELAGDAGVIVAETLADFEDLTRLFALLKAKDVRGFRLGAISNAGFECVAMADNLGLFTLAPFSGETTSRLFSIFRECRIESVVDVHNPVDLTPMTNDQAYEAVMKTVLDDPSVDIGVVGCVPLTPAAQTLPPGENHRENLYHENSIAMRMARLRNEHSKAWVAVVDGGAIYDPMVRLLEEKGIPTFRTADNALKLFNIFCRERLKKLS